MAQSYTTTDGTFIRPGGYAKTTVKSGVAGLATNGVLMLIGEAEQGPRFSVEEDLEENAFGPDQEALVIAKYGSGPLVEAFRAAATPANDPEIPGSPSRIIVVKTNDSARASSSMDMYGGTYGTLKAKNYGKLGNLIYWQVTAAASEVVPTTSTFTYIPAVGTVAYEIRVNGGAAVGGTLGANLPPNTLQSTLDGLSGVLATGGTDRDLIDFNALNTLALNQTTGNTVEITRSTTWKTTPTAGDTIIIPTTSPLAGGSQQNVGAYVVTSATSTVITATKLSDAGKAAPAPVIGTITQPVDVGAVAEAADTDLQAFAPITITIEAADPVDGAGKSLEIAQLTTGTDLLERTAFGLATTTAVTWVSKSAAPKLIVSGTEYRANLEINRQSDGVQEDIEAGGEVAFRLGYSGTTATVTITDTTLTTTVTGGSGGNLSLNLRDYPTIADLVAFISAQTGYVAASGNATLGQLPATALDDVTALGCATKWGEKTARIKVDGYKFFIKMGESAITQLNDNEAAAKGLPKPTTAYSYLSGGTKGATTNADFTAALTALERVRGNFIVPCISRNGASDYADGLTESGSTYTIDDVNAAVKTHCIKMSHIKRKKNRQGFLSKRDSFSNCREAAANLASFRVALVMQDFKGTDVGGNSTQFQSYIGAALAAGMQAAGFYKAIFNKGINTNGVLMADGSFDHRDDTNVEDALTSGLLVAEKRAVGGFAWISDQTTYQKDSNFVFNSIQAVYAADVMAVTAAERATNAFVGMSVADIDANLVKGYMESLIGEFMRLKLVAPSSDAPRGYRNLSVTVTGGVVEVTAELKLAGAIYFVPINFLISPVTQSA